MNDEERKIDYKRAANELWRWELAGKDLFRAATYLKKINRAKSKNLIKNQKNGNLPQNHLPCDFGVDEQEHYLQGKCLEVYIKSAYIKCKKLMTETDKKGKLKLKWVTHKLNVLCDNINFQRNEAEKETLDRLTRAIEFWGTYPIPSKCSEWRPDFNDKTGIQPVYVWSKIDDKNFTKVLKRIKLIKEK